MSSRGPPAGAPLPLPDADDTAVAMFVTFIGLLWDAFVEAERINQLAAGTSAAGPASEEVAALAEAIRLTAAVIRDEEEPTADDKESDIDVMSGPSATNGGPEGATNGGQEGATKGGQEGAINGGQVGGVDVAKDTVPASPVVDGGSAAGAAKEAAPLAPGRPLRLEWPCAECGSPITPAFVPRCPSCKCKIQWSFGPCES